MATDTVILLNSGISAGIIIARATVDGNDASKPLIGVVVSAAILALFSYIGLDTFARMMSYLVILVTLLYQLPQLLKRIQK